MCIFTFINMCKCIDDGIGTFDVVRFHSKYNHIIYTKRWMHIADSVPPVAIGTHHKILLLTLSYRLLMASNVSVQYYATNPYVVHRRYPNYYQKKKM